MSDAPLSVALFEPIDIAPEGEAWRAFAIVAEKGVIGFDMRGAAIQLDAGVIDDMLVLMLEFLVPTYRPVAELGRVAPCNAMLIDCIRMVCGYHQPSVVPVNAARIAQEALADFVPVLFLM